MADSRERAFQNDIIAALNDQAGWSARRRSMTRLAQFTQKTWWATSRRPGPIDGRSSPRVIRRIRKRC